mmetsp:Transcript_27306/g.51222  ORF Transcript_27306/g.51222 Transcript_27306/m.51222 type:complete len:113 (+) Transcript_27306:97-435(+)
MNFPTYIPSTSTVASSEAITKKNSNNTPPFLFRGLSRVVPQSISLYPSLFDYRSTNIKRPTRQTFRPDSRVVSRNQNTELFRLKKYHSPRKLYSTTALVVKDSISKQNGYWY